MPSPRFIVSGGGTGGHIFPAIAIANGLKEKYPDAEFLFVGAQGRMEMEKVPAAGYKIEGLWISGLQRKLTLQNLSFPFKVISSLWKARKIVNNFKPDCAIGVGGYASGPLLRVAAGKKVKSIIQEQNSYPGITNKLLAGRVDKICVAYEGLERWFPKDKIIKTGNPIRSQVVQLAGKKEKALAHFGLDPSKKTLLIVGGSLGARSINQAMAHALENNEISGVQILWQTGKLFIEEAETLCKTHNLKNVHPTKFITEMDLGYAAADIIISRAGAMAISELSLVKKPTVFVPYPFASEDHQTKNAMALVEKEAALLVKDNLAKTDLAITVQKLIEDSNLQEKLVHNMAPFGIENSTEAIVAEIAKLINI